MPSCTWIIPSVSALMTHCSRSGMRLSALAAVAGGGRGFAAACAPFAVLVGGAVGDAVAVELLEALVPLQGEPSCFALLQVVFVMM